jgi:hypothetical protein
MEPVYYIRLDVHKQKISAGGLNAITNSSMH